MGSIDRRLLLIERIDTKAEHVCCLYYANAQDKLKKMAKAAHCAVKERTFVSNSLTLSLIFSRNEASNSSELCS